MAVVAVAAVVVAVAAGVAGVVARQIPQAWRPQRTCQNIGIVEVKLEEGTCLSTNMRRDINNLTRWCPVVS